MNGKKAKILRKLVKYVKAEHPAQYEKKFVGTKKIELGVHPITGKVKFAEIDRYQVKLIPKSERGRYQVLKRSVKTKFVTIQRKSA